jgi:biotin carboxylase
MKSALILGTLYGQAEAMEILKKMGWKVHSCGFKKEGPGVEAADEFHLVDILDIEGVTEIARNTKVDCIYSVGSDIAMPTVAAVSEKLNLPVFYNVETIEILHRKTKLRTFLEKNNFPTVSYKVLKNEKDLGDFDTFPAILKPSDSQGQRGIFKVLNKQEAQSYLPESIKYSASKASIIEEWLDGNEISIHVIVVDGVIKLYMPSDRFVWQGEAIGIAQGHGFPSKWIAGYENEVKQLVEKFIKDLGIKNGPLYFQMKLTSKGPRIIEVAPRLDGCHLWRLIETRTGVNIIKGLFELLINKKWPYQEVNEPKTTHNLFFHLIKPEKIFHKKDFISKTNGKICFEQYQVEENSTPRFTGVPISRVGYYIEEIL